ncbi:hypothetical protein [Micromonospora cathayae]|uniref:FXSXX-COOH protein n=1 Tax=Micromonospora cathayae TaxID=3028804 RepID=A0ABY7ZQX9_9ACTN|nr:hypothetical protein [Micromonospora sp. HUAS 3]WDZ84473.1 hypothetical protein PVK37_29230 [Micromonospora sp. HUAS 3]
MSNCIFDPLHDDSADAALRRVHDTAGPYLASLADRPVHDVLRELLAALPTD